MHGQEWHSTAKVAWPGCCGCTPGSILVKGQAGEEPASPGAMTGSRGQHGASLQPMVCSVGQRKVCAGK